MKDLKQTQLVQLERKTVYEIMETQCRCHRNRLMSSVSLARRLPWQLMDGKYSYSRVNNDSSKTGPYDTKMLDIKEAKEDSRELKSQSRKSELSTNIWMQDNVFTFVERELKEMEDIHNPFRESDTLSEEAFHFVEMELMKLGSDVSLERSPPLLNKSQSCEEILRTPKEEIIDRGYRTCEQSFKVSDSGNGDDESKNLYQVSSLNDRKTAGFGDLCHASECQDLIKDQLQEENAFHILEKNEIDNDTVLCLKHLDQIPLPLIHYNTNSRKKPPDSDPHISQNNNLENSTINTKLDTRNNMSHIVRAHCCKLLTWTKDRQKFESIYESGRIQLRKTHVRKKQIKHRMHHSKNMQEEKILKGRKSKKIFGIIKTNYKLNNGRVKCNKLKKAHISRQYRNFPYKTQSSHNPRTLLDIKREPCYELMAQKSYGNIIVSCSSQNITKSGEFTKKMHTSQYTSVLPCSEENLFPSITQFSVPCHSWTQSPTSEFSLPSETIQGIQQTFVIRKPENSISEVFGSVAWDNNLYTDFISDEIHRMKTFHHTMQHIIPYIKYMNTYRYSDSSSLSPTSSIYPSTAPKIYLPIIVSSNKSYDTDSPSEIPAIPWPCNLPLADDPLQVMVPTLSGECFNDIPSFIKHGCALTGVTSDELLDSFTWRKQNHQNECLLSLKYIYSPPCSTFTEGLTQSQSNWFPNESFTGNVRSYSDMNTKPKYTTANHSDSCQNFKTYKTVTSKEVNNELTKIRNCCIQDTAHGLQAWIVQELTKEEMLPHAATEPCSTDKMLPGTITEQNEKMQELSDLDEDTEQLKTVPRIIHIQELQHAREYRYVESCINELCGWGYPVKKKDILELGKGSSSVCFSQNCTCEIPSFSMNQNHKIITQVGGQPREEIVCIYNSKHRYQEENDVADKQTSDLLKDRNYKDNEIEVGLLQEKIGGVSFTESNIKEQKTSVSAANTMTMSSIIAKEASKWKFQKYHPYILPKKRQEGMLRIAKVEKANGVTEVGKLIDMFQAHYCISENEFLDIDKDPFVHAFEIYNNPNSFISHGNEGKFSEKKTLFSGRTGVTSLGKNKVLQETLSLPQSVEGYRSEDKVNSETLEDKETKISFFDDDKSVSKDEGRNDMHVLIQALLDETSKPTAVQLALSEENITPGDLETVYGSTRFEYQAPKDLTESPYSEIKINLHKVGEDLIRCSQVFRSKVNPSRSQEMVKIANMVSGDNSDKNILISEDTSSPDFNQQKPEALLPVKTILPSSSRSLSEPGLMNEILSPSKSLIQQGSLKTQNMTSKRHQISSLNGRMPFKQQKLDFDNSSSISKLENVDPEINAVSQAHINEKFSYISRDYPSFRMFEIESSQSLYDVSSSENNNRVSPSFCDNISSCNTSEFVTAHPDNVDTTFDPHDRVSEHGKETVVLDRTDNFVSPTVIAQEDFSLVDSNNAVFISSDLSTVSDMIVDDEGTEDIKGRCMVNVIEKLSSHLPENKENSVDREPGNILDDLRLGYFHEVESSRDIPPAFVTLSQHLHGPNENSAAFASSSAVKLDAAFTVMSDSKSCGSNHYSCSHWLSPSNSLLDSPSKYGAPSCKAYNPQIKAAMSTSDTDFSKEYNVSKESKKKFCKLQNLEQPQGTCETWLLNNSFESEMIYHQTERGLLSSVLRQDGAELTHESYGALSKPQSEDTSNSLGTRKSVSDISSQSKKEIKKMLASPECKENQDILDMALKADLFDVIACGDRTVYSWPQIEESTLPVAYCIKNSDHCLGDRKEIMPITNNLELLEHSVVAKEKNLPFHYERNNYNFTERSPFRLGWNSTVVTDVGNKNEVKCFTDSFSKNNKRYFLHLNGDKTSEREISNKNVKSNDSEDESIETKDESVEIKDEIAKLKSYWKRGNSPALSLTHADQLPFRCEFCGRLFKHKRSRDRHVKLHTGDKKYKCCHCEAAFSRSDHLKIHKKTHDTQKPYQCSVCNRGYNTAAALTAHMQNHKAKLTAHALNQLLKDAQAPGETHALTQLLRDTAGDTNSQALNHFLKDTQKEQLLSPRGLELGARSSPGDLTVSPVGEPSPTLSPVTTVRCPICHAHCRNQAHLQRHLSRYHGDEIHAVSSERPASRGGGSGASSIGGASSAASTPSPRPPSSLPSPRPLPNPLLSLVGGKLACLYCSRDGFPSLEALQLHLQSAHGSVLNGEVRDMASMLGLPSSLGTSLSASGLATSLASPLGPGSSRGVSCELCGARVGGVTALQRHVVTAHTFTDLLARAAEGVFCAQCLLPFSNPGALAEHIKLVHTTPVLSAVLNKRPPSPPTDTPTDLSKKSRHEGLTSDLPASTLLCSQCNAPFTNFEAFRRHLKSHLDGGEQLASSGSGTTQLACPECRLPLTSEAALEAHLATHLGITSTEYGCQACLKLFSKPDELQKHLMDIHAHHLYRCALCKEMFDSKVSIQVHFAVKHSNECKVNKCTRCSLIFRSQSEFEGHIRMSHIRRGQSGGDTLPGGGSVGGSGGSYRCLLCTLSLNSEAELAAHVATHQRQFQCSLCDDAFHVEFLLDKHMQTQHNSELNGNVPQPENLAKPRRSPQKKDLRCDICDAEFSSDSGLLNHRKQAHNIKSGSVSVAAKVAAASLSLFCAYCSEACKSRGDLEAHMKSHQGNGGRHKCNICDELCPSAALLAQHKLTHIKVVSGSICAVCREPLTSEQQFTNHQNDHHPAPLPQPCVVCRQTLVTDMEVSVHARFHAAQAAQAAATASAASSILSSGELLPPSSNSSIITTAAAVSTITTNSNSSSHSSSSPRHSPSLRCPECHLKLETIEEAEAHTAAHNHQQQQQGFGRSLASSSRTYQCIKCQESFASEAEIEAHVASHLLHEGSVHECHLCRATFDTPLRLQCHLIEHTFEGCGSFTCYMCSSVFTTASRLQQHMVEHGLSARPYDCHHCHQRFFFRAELENHALSHPEATDGGCRECLASFPDLPRRSTRQPSLSCMTAVQHMGAHMTQAQANSDARLPRPSSPCSACVGDETDARPVNEITANVADGKDE